METERDAAAFLINRLVCTMLLIIVLQLAPRAFPLTPDTAAFTVSRVWDSHGRRKQTLVKTHSATAQNLPTGFCLQPISIACPWHPRNPSSQCPRAFAGPQRTCRQHSSHDDLQLLLCLFIFLSTLTSIIWFTSHQTIIMNTFKIGISHDSFQHS